MEKQLLSRLDTLESSNKRLRLAVFCMGIVLLFLILTGAKYKPTIPSVAQVVRTRNLEIIGEDGKTKASFTAVKNSPVLNFYDAKKKVRLNVGIADGEPGISLMRSNGKPAIALDVFEREYGTEPEPAFVLYDGDGKPRGEFMLVAVDEDPELNFYDKLEKQKVGLSVLVDTGVFKLYDADGKAISGTE